MRALRSAVLLGLIGACGHPAGGPPAPVPAKFGYQLGITSESGDVVSWVQPADGVLRLVRTVPVGLMPTDIDGPHNVTMAPDQHSYYVSIAHGTPYGSLWRLDAATDSLLGRAQLEHYPTTISLTPDGDYAFVANSDFYGDRPKVNPVSVVYTPSMQKIADIPACDMPHGVKVNHAGTRVYVTCMHSDEILEMEVATFRIARRASAGGPAAGDAPMPATAHAGHSASCAPTYVSVSPDDATLYVACNSGNRLQRWDAATMTRTGEVPVGAGAYNVEVSPDGTLVIVTNKKDRSISLVNAVTLEELARIVVTKPVVHGVAWAPDNQFAYISEESVGADSGAVDMIDIRQRRVVATLALPAQPTGITVHPR